MENINFKVNKIENAIKANCVVIYVQFESNSKEYSFVRKANMESTPNHYSAIIDGCKVVWNEDKVVTNIERIYETAGKKKDEHS